MASKTAKRTVKDRLNRVQENFKFSKVVHRVKGGTNDLNDFMVDTSDKLIDEAIVRSEQWQTVGAKAIKGGLKLVSGQQDIVFDTLETIKGQYTDGRKRFKNLFSKN